MLVMVTVLLLYQSVGCLVFAVVTQWLSAQSLTTNRISRRNRGKEKKGERPAKAGHFSLLFDPCSLSLSLSLNYQPQLLSTTTTKLLVHCLGPLFYLSSPLSHSARGPLFFHVSIGLICGKAAAEIHKHTLTVSSFNLILMPITPSPAICSLRSGSDFAM